jgi:hypothetical protein
VKDFFLGLPGRRLELGLSVGVPLLFGLFAWFFRNAGSGGFMVFTLEIVLPLLSAIAVAGLLAGDPGLDLLLSAPRKAWITLLGRILRVSLLSALTALALVSLAAAGKIPLPVQGTDTIFIWLPPLVFLSGVSTWGALFRGRYSGGAVAAVGFALLGYYGSALLGEFFRVVEADPTRYSPLVLPFLTVSNPHHPGWPVNRLLWTGIGLLLLAAALRLADREEVLLDGLRIEEKG